MAALVKLLQKSSKATSEQKVGNTRKAMPCKSLKERTKQSAENSLAEIGCCPKSLLFVQRFRFQEMLRRKLSPIFNGDVFDEIEVKEEWQQ